VSFDLGFHIHRLLRAEPFFASFSRRVEKVSDKTIPTAAMSYDKDIKRFCFLYNPDFFESLSDIHKVGVIKHEFYHLIFKHLTDRIPFDPVKQAELLKMWNIAADLAINTHIQKELPKMACVPGRKPFKDYIPGCTAEAYFEVLKKDKQNQQGPYAPNNKGVPQEPQTLDDHSAWGAGDQDSGGLDSKFAEEELADITKDAVKTAEERSSGWGSVPRSVQQTIKKSISKTISPEAVLRYFIKTSSKSNKKTTIKRINKRYPFIHPGKRSDRVANIAISIDQSGSVSDKMLQVFFSFLNKFASIATFTVVPFDDTVCEEKVYVWRKGEKKEWTRVRYGGTNFNAPTNWVNKRNFDGHIVITDMQAPKPVASKCQRLWITDTYNKKYSYFNTSEKILAIDI
jgi:predicted metal-dependent peptidase